MKILNFFYENHPKFEPNFERKVKISLKNTLIKGPKYCGKKSLILNFLSDFKAEEILFLDLKDLRFEKESLKNLELFLKQNSQIQILCLYNLDFIPNLDSISIPIILSTDKKNFIVPNFTEFELDYLDFEEFISASKKNLPINHLVGLFLQSGRSVFRDNEILRKNFNVLELEILKYLAKNLGKQISIAQLFIEVKNNIKTSKDSLYQSVKDLEDSFMIHSIFHDEKKLRKIYFRDFALKNALCIQKDFKHLFENLILNELFKLKQNFFYNKFFHFYSKDSKIAYISSPTLDLDFIKLRAKKILPKALELGIFHIFFITLSNDESFFEQGVKFEVLSFDKWALGF